MSKKPLYKFSSPDPIKFVDSTLDIPEIELELNTHPALSNSKVKKLVVKCVGTATDYFEGYLLMEDETRIDLKDLNLQSLGFEFSVDDICTQVKMRSLIF